MSHHCDRVEVLDSTKSSVLYNAQVQKLHPKLSLFRPSVFAPYDELLAIATFHRFSGSVSVQMKDGQHLDMRRNSPLSTIHTFDILGLKWSWIGGRLSTQGLRLIDKANGRTIAIYCRDTPLLGKILGIIVIFGTYRSSIVDMIIASGLAKIGYKSIIHKLQSVR